MMNFLWAGMIIISIISSLSIGDGDGIINAMTQGALDSVTLIIQLAGSYMLWMGLVNIAKEAGLMEKLANIMKKPLSKLFPDSRSAVAPITLNLTANFLGISSAATPFGLEAIQELQKSNIDKTTASDDMCMFICLNASAIELLPTTVMSLRAASGSNQPQSIILPVFVSSIASFLCAMILCKVLRKR